MLVMLFIITLPLNYFYFIPGIIIIITYIVFRLEYENFTFIYNERHIEIKEGILNKSQKNIPYNTIQNINIYSGWFMRMIGIHKFIIWTSSPAQLQIFHDGQPGYQTEHRPDSVIYLSIEDAETLKDFIISHR